MRQGAVAILLPAVLISNLLGCGPGGSTEDGIPAPQGAAATVAWDPVADRVDGYRVYWGTASRQYDSRADAGASTSLTVTNLRSETTYFFAVTAYNAGGESPYSSEVSAAIP